MKFLSWLNKKKPSNKVPVNNIDNEAEEAADGSLEEDADQSQEKASELDIDKVVFEEVDDEDGSIPRGTNGQDAIVTDEDDTTDLENVPYNNAYSRYTEVDDVEEVEFSSPDDEDMNASADEYQHGQEVESNRSSTENDFLSQCLESATIDKIDTNSITMTEWPGEELDFEAFNYGEEPVTRSDAVEESHVKSKLKEFEELRAAVDKPNFGFTPKQQGAIDSILEAGGTEVITDRSREDIVNALEEAESQIKRLRGLLDKEPPPPLYVMRHHLAKLSIAMPYEPLPNDADMISHDMQEHLYTIEKLQAASKKLSTRENQVEKYEQLLDGIKTKEGKLSSHLIGLKLEKDILELLLKEKARVFSGMGDETISLTGLDKLVIKRIEKSGLSEKLTDSGAPDSVWLMLLSKEIEACTTGDNFKSYGKEYSKWHYPIKGIGFETGKIIETHIEKTYPQSRSAFALVLIKKLREFMSTMETIGHQKESDRQESDMYKEEANSIYRMWKRFLGELYIASLQKDLKENVK